MYRDKVFACSVGGFREEMKQPFSLRKSLFGLRTGFYLAKIHRSPESSALGRFALRLRTQRVVLYKVVSDVSLQQFLALSISQLSWRHLFFKLAANPVVLSDGPFFIPERCYGLAKLLQDVLARVILV
jgi:hypothetical protein